MENRLKLIIKFFVVRATNIIFQLITINAVHVNYTSCCHANKHGLIVNCDL